MSNFNPNYTNGQPPHGYPNQNPQIDNQGRYVGYPEHVNHHLPTGRPSYAEPSLLHSYGNPNQFNPYAVQATPVIHRQMSPPFSLYHQTYSDPNSSYSYRERHPPPPPPPPPPPDRIHRRPVDPGHSCAPPNKQARTCVNFSVDSLLYGESRKTRPGKIVIAVRGLPGSGKSSLAQLIRAKENAAPNGNCRVISIDDFFVSEDDSASYEYDAESEPLYQQQLLKTATKQMDSNFYTFIILDASFAKVSLLDQLQVECTRRGFQLFVAEAHANLDQCIKRSQGRRCAEDIRKLSREWEDLPNHFIKLNCISLEQELSIHDVEMDESDEKSQEKTHNPHSPIVSEESLAAQETADHSIERFCKSKWDDDQIERSKDRLDGLTKPKEAGMLSGGMKAYLEELKADRVDELPAVRSGKPNRRGKRVVWADMEVLRTASKKKALGFVVGQTDWHQIVADPTVDQEQTNLESAREALVKVRYF